MLDPDYGDPTEEERSEFMDKVTSSDGAQIAFDRLGDGQPVIVVGGAMFDWALIGPTAEKLAKHFIVLNYNRRGRSDSGDTGPYAVEREIEDIGALIVEARGTASVYGHSSGAGLALHATAYGVHIDKLVLHEPPYNTDGEEEQRISREYALDLEALLSEGRRGDAVELFFTTVGMPREMVGGMRQTPRWAELEAMAPTLAYDSEIMCDSAGGMVPGYLAGGFAHLAGPGGTPRRVGRGMWLSTALSVIRLFKTRRPYGRRQGPTERGRHS